ncbi:MAG: hypothetical protein ACFFAS_09980 [Promethearchaeota archaeon]
MNFKKERRMIYFLLVPIIGLLHIFIPAWGIIIPEISAAFYWYWGFYVGGSGGGVVTGIIANETILNAGTTAMLLMLIGYAILLVTVILASVLKVDKTKKYLSILSIAWIILGILLIIAPSIYVNSIIDFIFDEYTITIGVFFSYALAIATTILGIVCLYLAIKSKEN